MTLIVKELIIKGIVVKDSSLGAKDTMDKEELKKYLKELQHAIKKECVESVMSKLESKKSR